MVGVDLIHSLTFWTVHWVTSPNLSSLKDRISSLVAGSLGTTGTGPEDEEDDDDEDEEED